MLRHALIALLILLPACGGGGEEGPVTVSLIGEPPRLRDPNRRPLSPPDAALMQALAPGLVGFDAAGQIEPAVAERWIVADEGRSFIFRLPMSEDEAAGPSAGTVARRLSAALAGGSRNPLKPLFGAVDEIVAVTPQVVELRLSTPRPELLQLLAQPELGLLAPGGGYGPYRQERGRDGVLRLHKRTRAAEGGDAPGDDDLLLVRGEPAARAVARFAEGRSQLVLGGRFADLPLARAADPRGRALRFDPVEGLFGLAFVDAEGFFGDPAIRRALDMAIDRDALAAALGVPGWTARTTLLPAAGAGLPPAPAPAWAALPIAERRAKAAAAVADWVSRNGAPPPALVRLPEGPGSRLLLNRLALDWQPIGVFPIEARAGERPVLRLVDEVAPAEAPAWYLLSFACRMRVPCTADADRALDAAERAPSLAERIVLLREAERLMAETVPFLPLGAPVRWALSTPRLGGFEPSPRGWHPLHKLKRQGR